MSRINHFLKFLESLNKAPKPRPYLIRIDYALFADYDSLLIGKTKICLQ